MGKKNAVFNPAFKGLKTTIETSQRGYESETKKKKTETSEPDDARFFNEAMSDVTPLSGDKEKIIRIPSAYIRPAHPAPDDERDVMSQLYGMVKGSIEMDITFSDEYMEGAVKSVNQKIMKKLKKGKFAIQDHIDLHGLTKSAAEIEVRDFLIRNQWLGHRCVLIVHGRGLNSPDSFPVLKEGLPRWLGRGPVRKIVLAFATARPYDGGTGAIYVLLKKR